jgi:hypothetical protein
MIVVHTWHLCRFSPICPYVAVAGTLPRVSIVPGTGLVQLRPVSDPSGSVGILALPV